MKHTFENRWYTKFGKAKRIPAALEPFRHWAILNKQNLIDGKVIELVKSVRQTYGIGLAEAVNLTIYLVGCYSNATRHGFFHTNGSLFTSERYELGKLITQELIK